MSIAVAIFCRWLLVAIVAIAALAFAGLCVWYWWKDKRKNRLGDAELDALITRGLKQLEREGIVLRNQDYWLLHDDASKRRIASFYEGNTK